MVLAPGLGDVRLAKPEYLTRMGLAFCSRGFARGAQFMTDAIAGAAIRVQWALMGRAFATATHTGSTVAHSSDTIEPLRRRRD